MNVSDSLSGIRPRERHARRGMRGRAGLVLALCLLPGLVAAGSDGAVQWRPLTPPAASLSDVKASPRQPAVVLAGFEGGIYRSTDAGATWSVLRGLGGSRVNHIAFASNGTAYAATTNRVWKSSDDGLTWTQLRYGLPTAPNDATTTVAVAPGAPSTVWVGAEPGMDDTPRLIRSSDGGATWTDRSPPANTYQWTGIAIDPHDDDVVIASAWGFAVHAGAVWVTTDGGATWQDRSAGLPNSMVRAVVYDGTRLLVGGGYGAAGIDLGLYASNDLGLTWTPLHDASWPVRSVTALAVDPARPQTILAATEAGGINRSSDGGATWTIAVPGSYTTFPQSISFNGASAYVADAAIGALRSADAGATFQPSSRGMSGALGMPSVAINPRSPHEMAVAVVGGSQGAVFGSVDGGMNWAVENAPMTLYSKLAFAPDGRLYALNTEVALTPSRRGVYRRAGDGSWTHLGLEQASLYAIRFDPNDANRIYVGGGAALGKVWRSIDAGQHWSEVYASDSAGPISDIEIDASGRNLVATYQSQGGIGTANGVIRSSDGGDTWSSAMSGLPEGVSDMRLCQTSGPSAKTYLLARRSGNALVFRSSDGGAHWGATGWSQSAYFYDIACDPLDPDVLYLAQFGLPTVFESGPDELGAARGGPDRVLRSVNGGVSFAAYGQGLETAAVSNAELEATVVNGTTRLTLGTFSGGYATQVDPIFVNGFDGS